MTLTDHISVREVEGALEATGFKQRELGTKDEYRAVLGYNAVSDEGVVTARESFRFHKYTAWYHEEAGLVFVLVTPR